MTAVISSVTPPSSNKSGSGRVSRASPDVQGLQAVPSYVDIYTASPLSQCMPSKAQWSSSLSEPSSLPHGHPEPPRWRGPRGFGARHINDCAPFTLWNDDIRSFRVASVNEMRYITETYNAERIEFRDWLLIVETHDPPKPVPLTVASLPAIFVPPGHNQRSMYGSSPCVSPRVADPCAHLAWNRFDTPSESQMINVILALTELANIERVNFLPTSIVVEIVHGDGRVYSPGSLPGRVAGMTTTYHHDAISFFSSMRDHTRERVLDPNVYLPGPRIGPLPQDGTNYLRDPSWGVVTPGVRVSTGSSTGAGTYASAVLSTSCGIILRKGGTKRVSVANHRFPTSDEVFHPAYNGDKLGDIVDRYPELDVAMVQPTPANSGRLSNNTYFQAEAPRRLAERGDLIYGTWFEVDGMSTGLLSFLYVGHAFQRPVRPPGHPEIPVARWKRYTITQIFGAKNSELVDGVCGAPFVEERTGNVAGFFHLANGDYAECALLEDLVAEGWEVV